MCDRSELAADRPVERDTGVVQATSRHTDTQETINSLMQKLSAAEEDAFASRCRYAVSFINAYTLTFL